MAITIYRLILALNFGFLLIRYVYATDEEYIIHPLEVLILSERNDLGNDIKKLAQEGDFYISFRQYSDQPLLPRFWTAVLSHSEYSRLEKDYRIEDIRPNSKFIFQQGSEIGGKNNTGDHLSRAGRSEDLSLTTASINASESYFPTPENITPDYTTQIAPVATELRVLSQPKNGGPIERYRNYVYRKDKMQETYIYHVEFGINSAHEDFAGREPEWVILPGADGTKEESPVGIPGHSTCTASKAMGNIYGASKKAKLVVVKMRSLTIRDVEEALDSTRDHILDNRRAGRSVVSISWASPRITHAGDYINIKVIGILLSYYNSGIYIVCSAGNYAMDLDEGGRHRLWADTLPACYSAFFPQAFVSFPIVVSNCYNNGIPFQASQRPRSYGLSAPGVNIMCAGATTDTSIQSRTGTSFSAPLVAGVLADFLASGQIPKQLGIGKLNKFLVREASWYRAKSELPTIWNMIDIEHNLPALTYANASFFNVNASFFETTSPDNAQFDVTSE